MLGLCATVVKLCGEGQQHRTDRRNGTPRSTQNWGQRGASNVANPTDTLPSLRPRAVQIFGKRPFYGVEVVLSA